MKWIAALAASAALLVSASAAQARHGDDGRGYAPPPAYGSPAYPPGYGAPAYPPGYGGQGYGGPGYAYPPQGYGHRRHRGGYGYGYGQPSYPPAYYGGGYGYAPPGYVRCKRRNNAGPAILGAIIGGALGNSAAEGRDRGPATVAGAIIGGAIGAQAGRGQKCHYDNGAYGQPYGYGY